MRIWVWRGFLGLALALLVGCASNVPREPKPMQETAAAPTTIQTEPGLRIAVVLPAAGQNAQLGKAMLNAAILAGYDIHNEEIALIPMDQAAVVKNPQRLLAAHINAVVGPLTANATRQLQPFAKANHIHMFSLSNDAALADDNTIVLGYRVETEVERVINYAHAQGHEHILVIIPNDAYGNAIAASLPVDPNIQTIRFSNAGDAAAGLKTITQTPDTIFLPVSGSNLPPILKTLSAANLSPDKAQYVSTGLWDDPGIWQMPELDGAWYPSADPMRLSRYEQRYQKEFGAPAPRLTALSYNAVAMIEILQRQSPDDPFNPDVLTNPSGFEGVDGVFRIMPDSSVQRALAMVEIRSRQPTVIQPPPDIAALIP